MDAGMRASLVTLVGYLGFLFLAMLVMTTLRINLTSLTWVVSALSVGIGFGLQQIVQNFISGLILLTERPVKVGDWVSLAGVEGDIRRINVRATEIQMSDRSTVIVPNSQFISQNVRNVTMGNALGVVGITLTLPLETDANKVRELLLTAFREHESILDAPASSVTFKDLTTSGMVLSVSGYVASPARCRARAATCCSRCWGVCATRASHCRRRRAWCCCRTMHGQRTELCEAHRGHPGAFERSVNHGVAREADGSVVQTGVVGVRGIEA